MNESIGYTVTINIIITFIVIVFVFLSNVIIYYKSNKVGNLIVNSIEKYNGFNDMSRQQIELFLDGIGYNKREINCPDFIEEGSQRCLSNDTIELTKEQGYCVYRCVASYKKNSEGNNTNVPEYYYYKIKANMIFNIPIINEVLNGNVFYRTKNLYNFEGVSEPAL